jgi:hypothetical protein
MLSLLVTPLRQRSYDERRHLWITQAPRFALCRRMVSLLTERKQCVTVHDYGTALSGTKRRKVWARWRVRCQVRERLPARVRQ